MTKNTSRVRPFFAAVFTLCAFASLCMIGWSMAESDGVAALAWVSVTGVCYWLMKVMEK